MRLILVCMLLLLSACSDTPPDGNMGKPLAVDYRIGHYMAPADGLYSNSFWVEGPQGLVLIGAQFLPEYALRAVEVAESYTGKKVLAAIVLHPSADQFNGVGVLKQRGIRVVSSQAVVDHIQAAHEQARNQYAKTYAERYPQQAVLPDALWKKSGLFEVAGLQLRILVIHQGQSAAHVLVDLGHQLFVGDLIVEHHHADLSLGDSKAWLQRLEEMERFSEARVIYPGRGYPMAAGELLLRQRDYLNRFRKAVAEYYSGGAMTEPDRQAIRQRLLQAYPDYGSRDGLDPGIAAEWEGLRRADHMMMKSAADMK